MFSCNNQTEIKTKKKLTIAVSCRKFLKGGGGGRLSSHLWTYDKRGLPVMVSNLFEKQSMRKIGNGEEQKQTYHSWLLDAILEGGMAITSCYSLCCPIERGWHQGQGRNSIEKWSMKKPWNGEWKIKIKKKLTITASCGAMVATGSYSLCGQMERGQHITGSYVIVKRSVRKKLGNWVDINEKTKASSPLLSPSGHTQGGDEGCKLFSLLGSEGDKRKRKGWKKSHSFCPE